MRNSRVFHVLACIDLSSAAGQRILNGIYRFLGCGYTWELSLVRSQKKTAELFRNLVTGTSFDGCCIVSVPENEEPRRLLASLGIPTVFFSSVDQRLMKSFRNCLFIHDDDRDIGRCGAQHLLAQGNLAGYGYAAACDERPWNRNRGEAFAAALARRGFGVSRLEGTDSLPLEKIAAWLKSLPSPAGVLAAYDDTAMRILEACRLAGMKVPGDVSVLGVGNDELVCPYTTPQLSSVIPDFEEEGYRAARELQALMIRRRPPARREILCGCKGVACRRTTVGERSAALLVQQAQAFIRENALKGITAADVVRHLHVSRRLADLRFREVTGTSILATLTEIRLEKVKELLATTGLRIDEIARQCGYRATNLKYLFARHVGCSMRDWRKGTSGDKPR